MPNSKYHESDDLGGGKIRHVQHIKPIAFHNGVGLRDITNVLARSGDPKFSLGVDELLQFRIRPKLSGKSPLIHFGKGKSHIRMTPIGTNNVKGVLSDNEMVYPGAWDGADLRATVGGHFVEIDAPLRTGHPKRFQYQIDSHIGFDPERLESADFRILQPVLRAPPGRDVGDIGLKWDVSNQSGKTILTVDLPTGNFDGWVLDPTLTLQPDASAGLDTYVAANTPTTNYGTSAAPGLRENAGGGLTWRTLIKFDLSSIPGGASVSSSTLSFWNDATGSAATIAAHAILAANNTWTEAGATWDKTDGSNYWAGDTGNDGGTDAGCEVAGTDYNAAAMGTVAIAGGAGSGTQHDITLNNAQTETMIANNYGFVLFSNADVTNTLRSSDHATAGTRPKIVIVYTSGRNPRHGFVSYPMGVV